MLQRTFIAFLVLLTVLAGCGRRGALDAPGEPEAAAVPADPQPFAGIASPFDNPSPGAQEEAAEQAEPGAAPRRRFILDPLI
jgi:predicted small lipoprotein YifL